MIAVQKWDPAVWVSNGVVSRDHDCLLLLHGVGGSAAMWAGVMKTLADLGIAAQACDLPGYGVNQAAALSFEQISQQLAAAVLDLQVQTQSRSFILVGHSYGGMIVQDFLACSLPAESLISGIALLCTSAAFGKTEGDFQKRFIESRLSPLREGKTMLEVAQKLIPAMMGSKPDPLVVKQAIKMMGLVNPQTYETSVQMIAGFDRRNYLNKIIKKCLLLAAQEDETAPPSVMQGLHERVPGSSFAQASGAGHLLPMEQPDWVAKHLQATFFENSE